MQALNIFYVLIAIAMVALILVQKGAGATAGAAFGSGASGTVFGARGAGNFLTRTTWVLATLFCTISLLMAVLVSRMSATPETDLGVMGSAPSVEESVEVDAVDPGLVIPDEIDQKAEREIDPGSAATDADVEQPETATPTTMEAVEDLPAIDTTDAANTEAGQETEQDDPASGSESDDS
jgi:preprotein translocase subunit SecG